MRGGFLKTKSVKGQNPLLKELRMIYRAILFCKSGLVTGDALAHYKFNNLEECIQKAKIYLKFNKLGDGYRIISSDGVTVSEITK